MFGVPLIPIQYKDPLQDEEVIVWDQVQGYNIATWVNGVFYFKDPLDHTLYTRVTHWSYFTHPSQRETIQRIKDLKNSLNLL